MTKLIHYNGKNILAKYYLSEIFCWLTDRLAGWLTGWLAGWLTDQLTDRPTDRPTDWPTVCPPGPTNSQPAHLPNYLFAFRLING